MNKAVIKGSYYLLFFALVSCGSKPVAENQIESEGSIIEDEGAPIAQSTSSERKKSEIAKENVKVLRTENLNENVSEVEKKLKEAIRLQDEKMIVQSAQELIRQDPKSLKGLNALGLSNYKNGKFSAALNVFNKAIKFHPNESDLYNNLGLILLALNENREALLALKKGFSLNPQSGVIGANLGAIYVKEKDYLKAEIALEVPVKKGIKDIKVQNNYAIALAARGKKKEAAALFDKLLSENPNSKEIMFNAAVAQIDYLGQPKAGIDILNRLKFVGVPSEVRNEIKELENRAKAGLK